MMLTKPKLNHNKPLPVKESMHGTIELAIENKVMDIKWKHNKQAPNFQDKPRRGGENNLIKMVQRNLRWERNKGKDCK